MGEENGNEKAHLGGSIRRFDDVRDLRTGEPLLMAFAPGLQDVDHRTQAFAGLRQAVLLYSTCQKDASATKRPGRLRRQMEIRA